MSATTNTYTKLQDFSFGKALLLVSLSILVAGTTVLLINKALPNLGFRPQ